MQYKLIYVIAIQLMKTIPISFIKNYPAQTWVQEWCCVLQVIQKTPRSCYKNWYAWKGNRKVINMIKY